MGPPGFSYCLPMWALALLLDVSASETVMTVGAGGISGADISRRPLTVVLEADANPTVAMAVLYKLRSDAVPTCAWASDRAVLRSAGIKIVFRFDPSRALYLQSTIALLLTEIQARGSLILQSNESPEALLAVRRLYRETYRRIR